MAARVMGNRVTELIGNTAWVTRQAWKLPTSASSHHIQFISKDLTWEQAPTYHNPVPIQTDCNKEPLGNS